MKLFTAILAFALSGCSTLPIRGKLCYDTPKGQVCAESDGTALFISGSLRGYAK